MSLLLLFNEHKQRLRITGTVLVIFSYQGIGFLLYSPRADLDHIINPLVLILVVVIAGYAWWVHRQRETAQRHRGDPEKTRRSPEQT